MLIAAERLPTRVGLRLALEPDARCTEAADARSAVDAAVRDRPDVCLLGLDPSGQTLGVVHEIATRVPSACSYSGGGMTAKEVRDEVVTIFMAGHETTAQALTWTWYLLSLHPAIVEIAREAIPELQIQHSMAMLVKALPQEAMSGFASRQARPAYFS